MKNKSLVLLAFAALIVVTGIGIGLKGKFLNASMPQFFVSIPPTSVNAPANDELFQLGLTGKADVASVERLLKQGAKVDGGDASHSTPLMMAAWRGKSDVVRLLLKYGANPNLRDYDGRTALMLASDVHAEEIVTALLKAGARIEARDDKGNTPLIEQANQGRASVVKSLLKHGAKVNARNNAGKTALKIANRDIWKDVQDALKQAGGME